MSIEKGILEGDVGSCECGSFRTKYEVDTVKKTVTVVRNSSYAWMDGWIKGTNYIVPHAGVVTLPEEGYKLIAVKKGEMR